MNSQQAKTIPLVLILEKIGFLPVRKRKQELIYFSPLREEKTPSFHLHPAKNVWYDFGDGTGGNFLDFVSALLASQQEGDTLHDALRWLSNMMGAAEFIPSHASPAAHEKEPSLIIKKVSRIQHKALLGYLAKRSVPVSLASPYLVELNLFNSDSGKHFFSLGMRNEEEGYELRNPFFKGCAGPKGISFVRGTEPKPKSVHLFEGMFDFVSALSFRSINQFPEDAIILHSLSCLKEALPYIANYGYRTAYTWLDNDKAGGKATDTLAAFIRSEDGLRHQPMNQLYHSHKDVSAWHMHRLRL